MRLYHGTCQETPSFTMYFSAKIEEARQFALGLDDCGNYNPESFIYATDVDDDAIAVEEDFDVFDALAYDNPELDGYNSEIVFNPESGWYIVKRPALSLVENFKNTPTL